MDQYSYYVLINIGLYLSLCDSRPDPIPEGYGYNHIQYSTTMDGLCCMNMKARPSGWQHGKSSAAWITFDRTQEEDQSCNFIITFLFSIWLSQWFRSLAFASGQGLCVQHSALCSIPVQTDLFCQEPYKIQMLFATVDGMNWTACASAGRALL